MSLLARGDYSLVASNDNQKWLLSKRSLDNESVYVLYHVENSPRQLTLTVSAENTIITDAYSGKTYQAKAGADGTYTVVIDMPDSSNGGTLLLQVSSGDIIKAQTALDTETPIAAGFIRMHFNKLPSEDLASLGLWLWEDVDLPSEKKGAWPNGATSFTTAKQDDYGYYLDIKLSEGPRDLLKWLINNTSGQNITGDQSLDILSQSMNEVWFDSNYKAHYYRPQEAGTIRINYFRTDGRYDDKSLWLWGSVDPTTLSQLGKWPDGINFTKMGKYGAYIDVKLSDLPSDIGFLLLDESKTGDSVKIRQEDYKFKDLKNNTQVFLKDDDPSIYTNPYFVNNVRMLGAQQIGPKTIEASMTSLEGADKESILKNLKVTDKNGQVLTVTDVTLDTSQKTIRLTGEFDVAKGPYVLTYLSDSFTAKSNWQYKDALYTYDGPLGARVQNNGQAVDLTIWSPSADEVSLIVYDKDDQNRVLGKVAMIKGDKGQWSVQLNQTSSLGIRDFRGYYYHYEINREGKTTLVLDPYAKSLAEWNSEMADKGPSYAIAKAAFVDQSQIGPKGLTYANIPGFKNREDAIIYEAHVRDFTSDMAISDQLKNQFGTFAAFAERLDYLQELGVTHIQLLPVMSYYFVNEMNKERLNHYASSATNYNWGYDPQSYFALTGMYTSDPTDPAKRILEFKELVNEIHKRGMGVILDVVYNHTAKVSFFEDLEPNYYHFMDADGTPRTSFGGGRLGTTHYMTRRLMLDSIAYMVSEFKVDGFRFDMMGDHDAASIEAAFNAAKALNPNIIMLGEGWVTYAGDQNKPQQPADQTWMSKTDTVASFSDDIRNMLKSGFGNEGEPAFLTGGSRSINGLFSNIKAQPTNFTADDPGDVIQYIAAHDNLTLFDIIAQSIKKDPSNPINNAEIHRRLRLGNLMIMTSQGTAFVHSGQEYGRTKQFRDEAYKTPVASDKVPNKAHLLVNADGTPFEYPYFIHDSYDSTDAINHFDWSKATDSKAFPENTKSQAYMKGLIALRRSSDAFRLGTKALVDQNVKLLTLPGQNGVAESDLVIGYQVTATNGDRYVVLINADQKERHFVLDKEWITAEVLVDGNRAGITPLTHPSGLEFDASGLRLSGLTASVLRIASAKPQEEKVVEHSQASSSHGSDSLGETKNGQVVKPVSVVGKNAKLDQQKRQERKEKPLQIAEQKAKQSASKRIKRAKQAMQKAQKKTGVKLKKSDNFLLKANALAVVGILAAGVAYFYKSKK